MDIVPYNNETPPITLRLGQLANLYAAQSVFSDYQERLTYNTRRRQRGALCLFSLDTEAGKRGYPLLFSLYQEPQTLANDLYSLAKTWRGITHGLC